MRRFVIGGYLMEQRFGMKSLLIFSSRKVCIRDSYLSLGFLEPKRYHWYVVSIVVILSFNGRFSWCYYLISL